MRALCDMNLPKYVFEDVPLFLGLISDLFPGLDCPRVRYPNFSDAVEQALVDNNYILLPQQVETNICVVYSQFCIFLNLKCVLYLILNAPLSVLVSTLYIM